MEASRAVRHRLCAAVSLAALLLVQCAAPVLAAPSAEDRNESGDTSAVLSAGVEQRDPYMTEVLQAQPYAPGGPAAEIPLETVSAAGALRWETGIQGDPRTALISDSAAGDLTWRFTVEQSGWYVIRVAYSMLGDSGSAGVRGICIDGRTPFFEASSVPFYRLFRDDGEVRVNSIGDEVRPSAAEIACWQETLLRDRSGYHATPLIFPLTAGEHTLSLTYISQQIALSALTVEAYEPLPSYAQAAAAYPDVPATDALLTVQAEQAVVSKNDPTVRLESDGDPSAVPISYGYRVYNAVGGYPWRSGGQAVTFAFTVPQTGLYRIALRSMQSWSDGLPSYRSIAIDGKIPFAELEAVRFNYSTGWQTVVLGDDGGDFRFYLEAGKAHTLTMTVVMGDTREIVQTLYDDISLLSSVLLSINQLTGSDPDPNYDHQFFKYIPTLEGDLRRLVDDLQAQYDTISAIAHGSTSMGSNFLSMIRQIQSLIDDPFSIAKRYGQLTQTQTNLGSWYLEMQSQPLIVDEFTLSASDAPIPVRRSTLWQRLRSTAKNFLVSFVKDYNNVGGVLDDGAEIRDAIDVWISRGNEWAEIVKEMADEDFTPRSGVLVNVNVVPASQLNAGSANVLMLSIVSGTAPDVVMGVAAGSPVEFAIRDAVVDLQRFSDFEQVAQRFLPQLFVPYRYNGGVYALPETMGFSCLFYRKDVLKKYGIPIPNTRQELYDRTLPLLFENGLTYYQNNDFTQFLYQHGGTYYTEDGYRSALDSTEAYQAFREYTEMFTHYSSPVSASFFNRFRTGEMPIGVGDYSLYIQLSTSAPELIGKWAIAPLPGIRKENGEVDRSCGTIAAECDMILRQDSEEKYDPCWAFLRWWSEAAVQRAYAKELEAVVGVEARWNTANEEAFLSLDWNAGDLQVIREQWKWAKESPVVLGGYYTGRYITNAFTNVVIAGSSSVRDALEEAVKEIDRELRNKQEEYGVFVDDTEVDR